MSAHFITRVVLENFKSIATCDVRLRPLNFLVGLNGAGKSNFLDALRFVSDNLRVPARPAWDWNLSRYLHRSENRAEHFGVRLDFSFGPLSSGHYSIRMGFGPEKHLFGVRAEECVLRRQGGTAFFKVVAGVVEAISEPYAPAASLGRLYLVDASVLDAFKPLYDALARMEFYRFDPGRMRPPQLASEGDLLARDGGNIANAMAFTENYSPFYKKRIEDYLAQIVPGLCGVESKKWDIWNSLIFRRCVEGTDIPLDFHAADMSDGTLRALAILVALFQADGVVCPRIPLVGIEEPEMGLHPSAARILLDSLREASSHRQVIVTSHSPDLLDDKEIESDSILAVVAEGGITRIGPIDDASRSVLRERLYTPGELLRINQIEPDFKHVRSVAEAHPSLFDPTPNP